MKTPLLKILPRAVRVPNHPLLEPRTDQKFWWEAKGIFNAGVTEYKNHIMLLYRAYDLSHVSRLGLAISTDGVTFERFDHPVIDTNPNDQFERLGIEDPRITLIDGTYYIVHTSASYYPIGELTDVLGRNEGVPWRVRTAMHTTKDWQSYTHFGVILPDVPAKNASFLPDKINGHFALYYRENMPSEEVVKISFTDDFQHWHNTQEIFLPTDHTWRGLKWGLGSQPIATAAGYLMVYHAIDHAGTYRLGILMFNKDNPAEIDWFSNPILEPERAYEKSGYVANVVYSCGALLRGTDLWIYYGGADRVMGRAVLDLSGVI
jgi:predicted GH43/DUF377 family glycosyl hydrolase